MTAIQPYAKAVVGFLAPGLLILGNALVQGDPVTIELALKALGAALVAGLAVYAVPNRDPNGQPSTSTEVRQIADEVRALDLGSGEPGEHRPERVVTRIDGSDLL